jgi:hypothetical protein
LVRTGAAHSACIINFTTFKEQHKSLKIRQCSLLIGKNDKRQKIGRLLVKGILLGEDTTTIRHSIPIPSRPPQDGDSGALSAPKFLLCTGRDQGALEQFAGARQF